MVAMEPKVAEIAERICSLRETEGLSLQEAAAATGVTPEEYAEYESGTKDFTFTFLYRCSKMLGVDMVEILTGEAPKLTEYTIVRGGHGLPLKRREGFEYTNLASKFKNKLIEPMLVFAPYEEEAQGKDIPQSVHKGQEFDYVIEGSLKFKYEKHVETLNAGDSIFYDSSKLHGMIAADKNGCKFLAIVMRESV